MNTWVDQHGQAWPEPTIRGRLKCGKVPLHRRLRDFVLWRDGYRCAECGACENLVADHIVSRRNGGRHHPSNLRALCQSCNSRKANTVDRKAEVA